MELKQNQNRLIKIKLIETFSLIILIRLKIRVLIIIIKKMIYILNIFLKIKQKIIYIMNAAKKGINVLEKLNITKKKIVFILIYEYNPHLPHDTYTFELFNEKFKTNKLENFNMINKK